MSIKSKRIYSIDVFRGLTMLFMIFVNDVASVSNIPEWIGHKAANEDAMGLADIVFPCFLFIVGMAIPLAIKNRQKKKDSSFMLIYHIIIRSAALIILGVFMVNMSGLNSEATGMNKNLFGLLMLFSAILIWNVYPKTEGFKKKLFISFKIIGIIGLILLAFIYRGGQGENIRYMQTSWWGILGLIGWSYLYCSILYILFKKNVYAMIAVFILFLTFNILSLADLLGPFEFLWIVGNGSVPLMTMAGLLTSLILMRHKNDLKPYSGMTKILAFGLIMLIAGYILRPYFGISKIIGTPSWALYCSAIATALFAFLLWLVDYKKILRWAIIVKPAGSNTLLTYLVPDILYYFMWLLAITFLSDYFGDGFVGIIRSIVFSFIVIGIVGILTRLKIRLQL